MKVLLCSYFKFPQGDAGALRHEKFALMLKEIGYDVLVVGLGSHCKFEIQTHNDISFTSLRLNRSDFLGKVMSRLLYWRKLKQILKEYKPDAVIMDDLRPSVTIRIKRFCNSNSIKLIHDSVEWYSPQQYKLGVFSPACIKKNIINRFLIDNHCRVIAISQYLYDHFTSKKIKCVNIPNVTTDDDLVKEKFLSNNINFTYAGQAGKKDYIDVILSAMSSLSKEELSKFKFNILGCTKEQIINNGVSEEIIDYLEPSLNIYGRVPRSKVLEVLRKTDFTILMRSDTQRYAKAGFPTKAVESLSHSTPVIANLTSDLHRYIEDGINGLVVKDCTSASLSEVLQTALKFPLEKRNQMCVNAYNTAAEKLYYKKFISDMKEIIK